MDCTMEGLTICFGSSNGGTIQHKETDMSMNEKQIVGESFEDLSDRDMAMLTGRGNDDVAPASSPTITIPITPYLITGGITVTLSLAGKCRK